MCEHVQRQQIAEVKSAVELEQVQRVGAANRHALVVNLGRQVFSGHPIALSSRVVVFSADV